MAKNKKMKIEEKKYEDFKQIVTDCAVAVGEKFEYYESVLLNFMIPDFQIGYVQWKARQRSVPATAPPNRLNNPPL